MGFHPAYEANLRIAFEVGEPFNVDMQLPILIQCLPFQKSGAFFRRYAGAFRISQLSSPRCVRLACRRRSPALSDYLLQLLNARLRLADLA